MKILIYVLASPLIIIMLPLVIGFRDMYNNECSGVPVEVHAVATIMAQGLWVWGFIYGAIQLGLL
jgi:hypothetical protein